MLLSPHQMKHIYRGHPCFTNCNLVSAKFVYGLKTHFLVNPSLESGQMAEADVLTQCNYNAQHFFIIHGDLPKGKQTFNLKFRCCLALFIPFLLLNKVSFQPISHFPIKFRLQKNKFKKQ